jgi:hypothetical protein
LEAQDDEMKLVELYTGKDADWIDSLTIASHEKIVVIGGEVNFPIFDRWAQRKAVAIERLSPGNTRIKQAMGAASAN